MSDGYEKSMSEKLAELGKEFNQNKGFGFMGMLENNHDPQSDAARGINQQQQQAAPSIDQALNTAPQIAAPTQPDQQQIAQIIDPINTAVQGLRSESARDLENIRNEINALRQANSAVPPAADGTVDPVMAKIAQMEQMHTKMHRMTLQDRALSSLNQMKSRFPDADLGESDFNQVWKGNNLDQNLSIAEGVDWNQHWEMVAKAKSLDKAQAKLRSTEQELERLRSNKPSVAEQMSSAPRTQRQPGSGLPQGQLLGSDGFDDQVYDEAVKIMGGQDRAKGRFMGFNRALVEAQRRLGVAGAR